MASSLHRFFACSGYGGQSIVVFITNNMSKGVHLEEVINDKIIEFR